MTEKMKFIFPMEQMFSEFFRKCYVLERKLTVVISSPGFFVLFFFCSKLHMRMAIKHKNGFQSKLRLISTVA